MVLVPGTLVANRFTIEKRAGAGGMGVVFRALDTHTGKPVAIKVLMSDDPDEIARFERESILLAQLRHPGVVAHLGNGRLTSGETFLAMEWLDGCDLASLLARQTLSLPQSLAVLRGAALALDVAHGQGIVHRDIKPGNLFLRGEDVDRVVLLDFGIARQANTEARLTHVGSVLGTPYYMAPEQAAGHADVGPAADIFSLGCVFFECLTGKPPFEGTHVLAILSKIIFDDAPSLTSRIEGVDPRLSQFCARMLAKQPQERIGNAQQLNKALDELGAITLPKIDLAATLSMTAADTISATSARRIALTGDELEVVCAIAMQQRAPIPDMGQAIDSITSSLSALGLRVEQLPDGTLVSTLARMGQATDQGIRAARAALLLWDRFPNARVALATGKARVGNRDGVFVGDAIDRVFRLLDLAIPTEGVHIDELTAGLLDDRFIVDSASGDASVLRGERSVTDQSKRLLGRPTSCVGREKELGMLQSQWEDCISEPIARAVLVMAPAGVGKSRIRHEFLQRLNTGRTVHTQISGRADPMASASGGVVARALRSFIGIDSNSDSAAQRASIETFVKARVKSTNASQITDFLGELVGVHFPDDNNLRLRMARQDARIMTNQLTGAFVTLMLDLVQERPVLFVVDDLHWCDAFSVAVLGAALSELKEQPFMVLAFARPEVLQSFPRLWHSHIEQVVLKPLRPRASIQLAQEVLGNAVEAAVLERIAEMSGGNALFLEELIRAVADGRGNESPETVLAMLQSRIGRLDPEVRRTLRAASIWGLRCTEAGIRALVGDGIDLEPTVGLLVEQEILERRRSADATTDVEYTFRHALVRDAAYALLVDEDRLLGHRLAAEWLESNGNADPAATAEHYFASDVPSRAIPHCSLAVAQLYERGDFMACQRFANQGIAHGAEGVQLGTLLALRAWIIWYTNGTKGWKLALPDVERAVALLPQQHPWWFRSIANMAAIHLVSARIEEGEAAARTMLSSEVPTDVGVDYVASCWPVANMACQVGRRELAKELLDHVNTTIREKLAHIPVVHAWRQSMELEYLRHNRPDPWRSRNELEEVVRICEQSGVTQYNEILVLRNTLAFSHAEIGDHATCEADLRANIDLGKRKRLGYVVTHAQIHLAEALSIRVHDMPVDEIESLTTELFATDGLTGGFIAMSHAIRATALLEQGHVDQAEIACRQAIERSGNFPIRRLRMQSILLRVLVRAGKAAEARQLALQAIAEAESLRGAGYAELPLQTAVAMAFFAAGDTESANVHLRQALGELNRQASQIPDPTSRMRFRQEIADNARTLALASEWGLLD